MIFPQIAKNTAFPANGVYQPCNAAPDTCSRQGPVPSGGGDGRDDEATAKNIAFSSFHDGLKGVNNSTMSNSSSVASTSAGASGVSSSPTQRRLVRTSHYGPVAAGAGLLDDEDADSDDPISFMAEQVQTGIEVGREAVCGSSGNQSLTSQDQSATSQHQSVASGPSASRRHLDPPAGANTKQLLRCTNSGKNNRMNKLW